MKRNYKDKLHDPNTITFNRIISTPPTDEIVTLVYPMTQILTLQSRGRYVWDCEVSFTDSDNQTIVTRVEGQGK